MSTISNERLGAFILGSQPWNEEIEQMATELLALRKERERAEPVVKAAEKLVRCKGRYHSEQNYRALAALFGVTTPDLPPLETDTTAQQFESLAGKAVVPEGWKLVPVELTKEMRGKIHPFAEATCLDCGRQVVADCEDNVTASWNDMLAVAPEPCK